MTVILAPSTPAAGVEPLAHRRLRAAIGILLLTSAAAGGFFMVRGAHPLALVAILVGCLGTVGFAVAGPGATMAAGALLVLAPSILGESSTAITVAGVAVLVLCAVSQLNRREPGNWVLAWVLLPLAVGFTQFSAHAAGVSATVVTLFAVSYLVLGLFGGGLSKNPALIQRCFGLLALALSVACVSYFVSWAIGFPTTRQFDLASGRELTFSLPVTFTGGVGGFLPALPRFLGWSGEAGLLAEYLLPIIIVLGLAGGRRLRAALLALTVAVAVIGQSTGTVLALVVGLFVLAVAWLFRRGHYTSSVLFLLVGAVVFGWASRSLLALKLRDNAGSVSDRGLAAQATSGAGDINLISTMGSNPFLASCLIIALVALVWFARRQPLALGGAAAFTVVAVFNQPTQWHIGGLVMIALAISYSYSFGDRQSPTVAADHAGTVRRSAERVVA